MNSNATESGEQQVPRGQNGRLGQRIARYLFVTLLAISAIEYVPSYFDREQDLLQRIEKQGARTMSVLLSGAGDQLTPAVERHSKLALSRTPLMGFTVYRKNGEVLWSVGEPVKVSPTTLLAVPKQSYIGRFFGGGRFDRTDNGKRFLAVWGPEHLGAPYRVAARLDSTQIIGPLSDYRMSLIWMALAMAAVTTIVMLIVLNRLVLKPVTAIHEAVSAADDNLSKAHEQVIENPYEGEIGDLTNAVNRILRNVSENVRVVQKQNEKILQEANLRQQAEEAAQLKHRQLVEAIEAFPGGFAVFDSEDRLMLCNESWKDFYTDSSDIIVPGVKFEDILRSGIAAERKRGHFDYGAFWFKNRLEQHCNGTTDMERRLSTGQWMRTTERRTEDGGILGIWTDISSLKAAESDHADLQEQFFRAQKNEALGTLAGGIAHDFDDLIATILGNVSLLEGVMGSNPAGREELQSITDAGKRAKELVQQILSFARQNPGEFERIDLYDVAEEALSLLRSTIPRSITTEARIGRSAQVFGDPTQLHQIVMNLCINARDAIGDKPGKLVVDIGDATPADDWPSEPENWTDSTPLSERVIIQKKGTRSQMWTGVQPTGTHIRLSVSDTGAGIGPDDFQKIFDPFFTTKDAGKGTGLGLAAVQGIVHSHGGSIHVDTTPGEGTRFEIRIPRQEADGVASVDEVAAEGKILGRILIVDNEDQSIAGLGGALEGKGYQVSTMTDAAAALKAVEDDPDHWDVVIADLKSPEQTGGQIARDIRSIRQDLPVILCGEPVENAEAEQESDTLSPRSVLAKPVQESALFDALEHCLDRAAPEALR